MSFKDILGQEGAVKALKSIILKRKFSRGYLFLGPEGIGKRMAALDFAKAINCEKRGLDSCDQCLSCKKIDALNHPDVFLIQRESKDASIKIDTIRGIIYQSSLKPYEADYKIFIILNAWALTDEACNCLLKILEEPPEGQIFIMTTTDISRIFPTIVSRCQVVRFNRLSIETIRDILVKRFGIEQDSANFLAHICGQDLSRALELKDRDCAGLRDTALSRLTEGFEGLKDREILEDMLILLLNWYRDILILKFRDEPQGLINIDRYQNIFSESKRFSTEEIEQNLDAILTTLDYIRNNINPRLALEVLFQSLK